MWNRCVFSLSSRRFRVAVSLKWVADSAAGELASHTHTQARAQRNTGMYLLTFLEGVKDTHDAMMTHARQRDRVAPQNVCHDLTTLRLVQLVGHSLLEHEHRSLLQTMSSTPQRLTRGIGDGPGALKMQGWKRRTWKWQAYRKMSADNTN